MADQHEELAENIRLAENMRQFFDDQDGLAENMRRYREAVAEMTAQVEQLGRAVVRGRSPDGVVRVRVTDAWRSITVELSDDAFLRYNAVALADVITRTVRGAQRRARKEFEEAAEEVGQPRFWHDETGRLHWARPE